MRTALQMVTPLSRPTIVKKRTKRFKRHQTDMFLRIRDDKWRKPKGIDNPVRRRFKGCRLMPSIGYGSANKTKHMLPNGFLKFRVNNVRDLELLLMHNRKYAAEISHNVSGRNRKVIVERAAQLNIKVRLIFLNTLVVVLGFFDFTWRSLTFCDLSWTH